jgi:hypothetical protein
MSGISLDPKLNASVYSVHELFLQIWAVLGTRRGNGNLINMQVDSFPCAKAKK